MFPRGTPEVYPDLYEETAGRRYTEESVFGKSSRQSASQPDPLDDGKTHSIESVFGTPSPQYRPAHQTQRTMGKRREQPIFTVEYKGRRRSEAVEKAETVFKTPKF